MESFLRNLNSSLQEGFVNKNQSSIGSFKPELLINNAKKSINVLNTIQEELETSEDFIFSVAFVTESGLATMKSLFLDLKEKGVTGRILTSTYLYFNQPKVFRELMKLTNVEVRLTQLKGFHSKGYIFKHKTHYSLIVGSSNLTAHALKVNYEWNVKLTSHENGDIVHHFKNQFEDVWEDADLLTGKWIEDYEIEYLKNADRKLAEQVVEMPANYNPNAIEESMKIVPNAMQKAALLQIRAVRDEGNDKGLVISATGTGKTYLSAFDVRSFAPKRMLFIVHREQILNKAKEDFHRILGGIDEEFGLYVGASKQLDKKYLFASIQTLSKQENLNQFDPRDFDYILIDEVHKAGAASYQRVINYFKPQFLMGMTATPERTDEFNIYSLFDYNIAYEIRLQEALEEDMLCPFHYFGVTDLELDGESVDDTAVFTKLVTDKRVNHIIEKINYYGFSGEKVKGLMFCSRKAEARELSIALNKKGFRTVALTGDDSPEERERRITQLENGFLDYILTVDIFNEGIDIPSINQVVMLRQTQSSIIFIQQLGRGLRKHNSKNYVTIIDFIGNYKNNYLIPVALSGDKSQNKDNVRRRTKDTSYIKGVSTVNFEEIAKKRIFSSINDSNLTALKVLRDAYVELKNKIGRVPYLYDFVTNHSIDPVVIVEKHTNYYQFLLKMKEEVPTVKDYEDKVLTMLSLEVLNGKRLHEILLLEQLLQQEKIHYDAYLSLLTANNCRTDVATMDSVNRLLYLSFFTTSVQSKYGGKPLVTVDESGNYTLNELIREGLTSNPYFGKLVQDIIHSAKSKSELYECSRPLTLYEKYSRKDACKLLNWNADESSTMYGYKPKHNTCPIFITYHKNEEVESSVNYGDELLNPELLKWYTRSNRSLRSQEVQKIIHSDDNNIDIHIFVKKDDDEGTDFYYLGQGYPDKSSVEEDRMTDKNGKDLPVVHMNMAMEQAVEGKLYHYLIDE
ncbi:DEAD/DEAH box helicase [Filibacter tadaridae]|uniref:Type I restriction enzyme EcoKI subunit R n=1 Tax=Filibacter tadaridae TaxID=2483811 RepID=A0A3P5WSJ2_9BACL|nr:DEAD/DEAH box helicase [Filibacter tadaridae]VDC21576.1 type I restriction enzyme EcoKI subunit R [Filibacter tadaridae]